MYTSYIYNIKNSKNIFILNAGVIRISTKIYLKIINMLTKRLLR